MIRFGRKLRPWLAVISLIPAIVPGRAEPAVAQLRAGILDHATRLTSSGREHGFDFNLEIVLRSVELPGAPAPYLGVSLSSNGGTDQLYGGLWWTWQPDRRWFAGLGPGFAVHNGDILPSADARGLGRRWLFHSALEAGIRLGHRHDLALYYQHVSNGPVNGRQGVNNGLDNIGLRVGYRF